MTKLPSRWIILLCLWMFGMGELAGAMLGGFGQEITDFARGQASAHPKVHGLVGVEDIDRAILNEVGSEALSRIHTFHLHAHGLSLVVFVLSLVLANMPISPRLHQVLSALVCVGLIYPFGWLLIALTVPALGKSAAFDLAEKLFFAPFGGGFLVVVWVVILAFSVMMLRSRALLNSANTE